MTRIVQRTSPRSSDVEKLRMNAWREHSRLLERAHAILNDVRPDRVAAMGFFKRAAEAGDRLAALYDAVIEPAIRAKVLLSTGNCWYRAMALDAAWQALDEARFLAVGTLTAELADETLLQIDIARVRAKRAAGTADDSGVVDYLYGSQRSRNASKNDDQSVLPLGYIRYSGQVVPLVNAPVKVASSVPSGTAEVAGNTNPSEIARMVNGSRGFDYEQQ